MDETDATGRDDGGVGPGAERPDVGGGAEDGPPPGNGIVPDGPGGEPVLGGNDARGDLRKAVIEHLSKDIISLSGQGMTFRSRMGFTLLVGPFVMLGTLLVATKGELPAVRWDRTCTIAAVLGTIAYLCVPVWGAIFDSHVINTCNRWRRVLVRVSEGTDRPLADYLRADESGVKKGCALGYSTSFFLILLASACVTTLAWKQMSSGNPLQEGGGPVIRKITLEEYLAVGEELDKIPHLVRRRHALP